MDENIERRRVGVTRVRISDGNGGGSDVYTMTANRVKVWAGALIAVITLLGMVFAATRLGLGVEIKQVIEQESKPPDGHVYQRIDSVSQDLLEEVQAVIQDDLDDFEGKIKENRETIIRIEERQIAIQKKMAEDKADLIREIRRAGDG